MGVSGFLNSSVMRVMSVSGSANLMISCLGTA
jgi:hypothetical protein